MVITPFAFPQEAALGVAVAASPAARLTRTVSVPKISTVGSSNFS